MWPTLCQTLTAEMATARGQYGMAVHTASTKLVSASGSKIQTWDLRKVAAEVLTPEQVSDLAHGRGGAEPVPYFGAPRGWWSGGGFRGGFLAACIQSSTRPRMRLGLPSDKCRLLANPPAVANSLSACSRRSQPLLTCVSPRACRQTLLRATRPACSDTS